MKEKSPIILTNGDLGILKNHKLKPLAIQSP